MSETIRVSFTYNNEYDIEIHKMLENVPERRRSERIRQLLIIGLKAERINSDSMIEQMQTHEIMPQDKKAVNLQNDSQGERRRPTIHFKPPSQQS